MRSPLRLLTIAFVLAFAGPSLRPRRGRRGSADRASASAGWSVARREDFPRAIDNRANAGGLVQEAWHHTFGPRSFVAGHDIS